jgi:DNA-binding NtrC family response regulator
LSKLLTEKGYTAKVCTSGAEGLKLIKREPFDLVLLDMILPQMDGIQTLRQIKKLRPNTAVIMMTGQETVKTAVEAIKLGAYDYLPKPLTMDRLGESIRQALRVRELEQGISQRETLHDPVMFEQMIGQDLSMRAVFDRIHRVAPQDVTVLIQGESGTGKELIARGIHALSPRREYPFIPVDCSTLPEPLFESEVFGYERGAFTGAEMAKPGRFEMANNGTLFLDEIGNLSLTAQAKLLRVLQEREVTRLGAKNPIKINVRILAATNQNLEELMARGSFREDLFHRLNVFTIDLPPLRQRGKDIPLLTEFFRLRLNHEFGKKVRAISQEAMRLFSVYSWPGNVRELENTIKSAVLLAEDEIRQEHLPEKVKQVKIEILEVPSMLREMTRRTKQEIEKPLILRTLRETHGNKREAARRLGIDYKTLYNKLKSYEVSKENILAMK